MTKTQDYIDLELRYGAKNYQPLDVVLARGEGVWVEDVEGRRYMDFLASYSALNHGHRHPRLLRALTEQAGKLTITSRALLRTSASTTSSACSAESGWWISSASMSTPSVRA